MHEYVHTHIYTILLKLDRNYLGDRKGTRELKLGVIGYIWGANMDETVKYIGLNVPVKLITLYTN